MSGAVHRGEGADASHPSDGALLSAYAFAGASLVAQGYSAIPIMPYGKAPGEHRHGNWHPMSEWQRFCDRLPTQHEVAVWERWPDAGLGVACGRGLIAVDIDRDDLVDAVTAALPSTPVAKRGAKGVTLFFRGDTGAIRTRSFRIAGRGVLDLLANGRQTVLPPTMHPTSGGQYGWTTLCTLADLPLSGLPVLPENVVELIEAALVPFGYEVEAERPAVCDTRPTLTQPRSDSTDFFRRLNEDALASLDAWVPQLGIRCRRQPDGGYRAVPEWRPSNSGKPTPKRALNLSFDARGIRDFGDGDKGYTPLNVVMEAKRLDRDGACRWLGEWIGYDFGVTIDLKPGSGTASTLARDNAARERTEGASEPLNRPGINATPFRLDDPALLPRREWLYGTALIRRFLSVLVAPGGVGKSSLTITEALAMVSGRPLLGVAPVGCLRVWLWNGEDPRDELERRFTAACLHYSLEAYDIGDRLFIDSGREARLVVMREVRKELVVAEPLVEGIVAEIEAKRIDVLIVDPFVTTHEVTENDNGAIARVAYLWSDIADRTGCAVLLVHHTKKMHGNEVTAEDSRGGVALVGAARVVRVLNAMTTAEADEHGISPDERPSYVRVGSGKANLARRSDRGVWFRLVSVPLGNGRGNLDLGDEVAVATAWAPTSGGASDTLSVEQIAAVQAEVAEGEHRLDERSPQWVGNAVTSALGISISDRGAKRKVKGIIDSMIADRQLKLVKRLDASRKEKAFVEVGERLAP